MNQHLLIEQSDTAYHWVGSYSLVYSPAFTNRAQRHRVTNNSHKTLGTCDGSVQQFIVRQKPVVGFLFVKRADVIFGVGRFLSGDSLAGVQRPHRTDEQCTELFAC